MPEEVKEESLDSAFEGEKAVVEAEKNWSDYGIEDWNELGHEQIAERVLKERNSQGSMMRERDSIRSERDALQAQIDQISGVTNPGKEVIRDEIADMDDFEKQRFFQQLETSPRAAISGLLKDSMPTKDSIAEMISEKLKTSLTDYDQYNQAESIKRTRPEFAEHQGYIEFISKPEYLGDRRSLDDKLDFAVLHKENPDLSDMVYDLLARTNMPFADAKEYAEFRSQATNKAAVDKDELRDTIDKVKSVSGGGKQKASETEKIESMEEAFNV